jgi:hypothetical protein
MSNRLDLTGCSISFLTIEGLHSQITEKTSSQDSLLHYDDDDRNPNKSADKWEGS